MNILKKTLILAGCVAALGLGTSSLMAQPGGGPGGGGFGGPGGGGFGRGRGVNLDAWRQALQVTNEADWTAISSKITALSEAQRGMFGRGRGRGGRGGGGPGGGGGFQPPAPTDAEAALQKAIDDKAPAADLKTKIAAVRKERADRQAAAQAAYAKAEEDLRGLLSARQEAIATLGAPSDGDFPLQPLFQQ